MLRQLNHFVCSIDLNSPKDENLNCWFSSQKRLASNLTHTHTDTHWQREIEPARHSSLPSFQHMHGHMHTHTISHCSKWDLLHQPSACHPFLMGWLKAWLPWWITPCLKERESEWERERGRVKRVYGMRRERRENEEEVGERKEGWHRQQWCLFWSPSQGHEELRARLESVKITSCTHAAEKESEGGREWEKVSMRDRDETTFSACLLASQAFTSVEKQDHHYVNEASLSCEC